MRSEEDASRAIDQYADTVRRICMVHLKNYDDTEDIFQTVFLKYVLHSAPFDSEEHEKAWIIRVTINACKDFLKNVFRRRTVPLDQIIEKPQEIVEYALAGADIVTMPYHVFTDTFDSPLPLTKYYVDRFYKDWSGAGCVIEGK